MLRAFKNDRSCFKKIKSAFALSYRPRNQFLNLAKLPNGIFTEVSIFAAKAPKTSLNLC